MLPFSLESLRRKPMFPLQEQVNPGITPNMGTNFQVPEIPMGGMPTPMEPDLPSFTPETRYNDMLAEMLQQMPQRPTDFSFGRKLAAGLSGAFAGPQAADNVLYGNFNRQAEDYDRMLRPTMQAAQLERQSNVAGQQRVSQDRAASLATRKQDALEKKNAADLEIRQKRADAYDFRSRNPTWKPFAPKGGTLRYVNPTNPSEMIDTGIPTGSMTDMDRLNLAGDIQSGHIEQRGNEARATENVRQTNRESTGETRGWEVANIVDEAGKTRSVRINKITGEVKEIPGVGGGKVVKPGTETGSTESATQKRVAEFIKAREAVNTHPEWSDFIKIGDPNQSDFTVTPPSTKWYQSGPDQATHAAINEFIYGKGNKPTPPAQQPSRLGGPGPAGNTNTAPVKMRTPSGEVKMIPADKVAEAEKRGAKRIQ